MRSLYCISKLAIIFFSLFLFMGCALKNAVEQESSSLSLTGLLAFPQETAEEILVRAHQGDARAMALAVAGYGLGIHGFPWDLDIAYYWSLRMDIIGANNSAEFLICFVESLRDSEDDRYGLIMGRCDLGRTSVLVAPFTRAKLFDINIWCNKQQKLAARNSSYEEARQEHLSFKEKWVRDKLTGWDLLRALRNRPTTPADERLLINSYLYGYMSDERDLMFFAGSNHKPDLEEPDWTPEAMLAFRNWRTDQTNKFDEWASVAANEYLLNRLVFDPAPALDIIRRAHQGDIKAIRTMADCYHTGGLGFSKDKSLHYFWLHHGAVQGDALSMLILAIHMLPHDLSNNSLPWGWAFLAYEAGDDEIKVLAKQVMNMIEEHSDEKSLENARLWIPDYRKRIQKNREKAIP